ncbi:MAG: RusA family crossover junction endodeoxyribonuclease [Verrucomicrobiaceae bacterium]|nr:MAG: RusA family crossover junction endodeoxyribonuclease [Verrucomicrobiaceae bacterium]
MSRVSFFVRGSPRPTITQGERTWKLLITTTAQEYRSQCQTASEDAHVTVQLVFHLSAARLRDADLDNLCKPVLDTLFTIKANPQSGALMACNDSCVDRLVLEKHLAKSQEAEGMEVLVEWS